MNLAGSRLYVPYGHRSPDFVSEEWKDFLKGGMNTDELEAYLTDLQTKLKERKLQEFWVMADRADFKVMKMERREIEPLLKERAAYYRGKRIAAIQCYVNPRDMHTANMFVMSIKVMICEISSYGAIDTSSRSCYGLRVNFFPEDFSKVKFSLGLVESLLRLAAGKKKDKVETDTLNGVSYEKFKKLLLRKDLSWAF